MSRRLPAVGRVCSAGSGDCWVRRVVGAASLPFQEQVAQAQKEPDAELRARQLIKIARQQRRSQDSAGAEETLELAAKDCQAITDAAAQANTLVLLAEAQAGLGNRAAARRAIDLATVAADGVKEAETKAQVLARIAQAQGAAGDAEGGAATLESAEELAAKLDDVQGRTLVLLCRGRRVPESRAK